MRFTLYVLHYALCAGRSGRGEALKTLGHFVVLKGLGGAELPQSNANHEDRQQNGNGSGDRVLRSGHGQLINPRYQDVSTTGVRAWNSWATIVEQVNDVEVVEVEGVLGDDDWGNRG